MWSVHQPWDPLKVCVVGKSYPPCFYEFIENPKLRELFQTIAQETEEDYLNLEKLLQSFGVVTIRADCPDIQIDEYLTSGNRVPPPISMNPRDQMIMVGDKFYFFPFDRIAKKASGRHLPISNWTPSLYDDLKGPDWPMYDNFKNMPDWVKTEIHEVHGLKIELDGNLPELSKMTSRFPWWDKVLRAVRQQGNQVIDKSQDTDLTTIPTNGITPIGKDLYFGVDHDETVKKTLDRIADNHFQNYRCHRVTTGGHIDGCFAPIKPGLIVSIHDIKTYAQTFPGWEVIYLQGEGWSKMKSFLDLKQKNQGRWWIKGHEHDDELINFVETWLQDWVGYVEETVFDVNILVIDQQNIIVNGYNATAFEAFKKHGITAHVSPMRHRYFWDGGVHCVTLDLDRDGDQQDFFPDRNRRFSVSNTL